MHACAVCALALRVRPGLTAGTCGARHALTRAAGSAAPRHGERVSRAAARSTSCPARKVSFLFTRRPAHTHAQRHCSSGAVASMSWRMSANSCLCVRGVAPAPLPVPKLPLYCTEREDDTDSRFPAFPKIYAFYIRAAPVLIISTSSPTTSTSTAT